MLRQRVEVVVARVLTGDRREEPAGPVHVLDDPHDRLCIVVAVDEERDADGVAVSRDERRVAVLDPEVGGPDLVRRLHRADEQRGELLELRLVGGVLLVAHNDDVGDDLVRVEREVLSYERARLARFRVVRDGRVGGESVQQRRDRSEGEDDDGAPDRQRPPWMPAAGAGQTPRHAHGVSLELVSE